MTIILFLVDTSASMNMKTFLGTSLLDISKNSIENFLKIRSKNPSHKMDRLMLLTFDEPPRNIKAGWKENHNEFAQQLKNLSASGVTEIGSAFKNAFDMLNTNRNYTGIDTYGQGRCPFYVEPAIIICFTDGQSLVTQAGIQKQLILPMLNGVVGSELTKEPFRWDQRVFGVVLRFPAVELPEVHTETTFIPSAENSPIDSMCEVTGGRSYLVTSSRQLGQTLESLAQKTAMHGVVVNFEYIEAPIIGNDENSRPTTPTQTFTWKNTKRMIFVKASAQRGHMLGHWPIPESFWPDPKGKALAPRDAQPYIKFSAPIAPPAAHQMTNVPVDVYELEPSPLTQHILKNKNSLCYQTFISASSKYCEHPFGFLQANNSTQKVFLHVMPYNYPVFLNVLEELQKSSMKTNQKWKAEFDSYLRMMPGYYAPYLRKALGRMGVHGVVPESLDNCLSLVVVSHLKQVKVKAKMEYDSLIASVSQHPSTSTEFIQVTNKNSASLLARQDFNELLKYTGGDYSSLGSLQRELAKYETFPIAVPRPNISLMKVCNYRNPYDIARKDLLAQISRLRAALLNPSSEASSLLKHEHLHNLPIQQMGNYHEYLAKAPQPLRKLETQAERLHTFGNPFKVNKNLMIDEADEAMPGMTVSGSMSPKRAKQRENMEAIPSSPARKKRKPGPLPRDITLYNRPTTPPVSMSPYSSPVSSPRSPSASLLESPLSSPDVVNGDENELMEMTNLSAVKPYQEQVGEVNGQVSVTELSSVLNTSSSNKSTTPPSSHFSPKILRQSRDGITEKQSPTSYSDSCNEELLRSVLLKEVKRPGKDYTELLRQLKALKGTPEQRKVIMDRVIYECYRFKRFLLVDQVYRLRDTVNGQISLTHINGDSKLENILEETDLIVSNHKNSMSEHSINGFNQSGLT